MSIEAERKARQREGFVQFYFEVHESSFVATLLAEGLITDAQIEDRDAIREAGSRFIARHSAKGRLLRDGATQRETASKLDRPKAKRQERPKHGPVQHWTPEEIEAWESGKARVNATYANGEVCFDRDGRRIIPPPPTYNGYIAAIGGTSIYEPGRISELPPDWADMGRSGDRDGRNRARITGTGSKKESAARKIRQLDDKALKRAEQPYADKLKVASTSPHFVQTSAREVRSMHGLNSTKEESE